MRFGVGMALLTPMIAASLAWAQAAPPAETPAPVETPAAPPAETPPAETPPAEAPPAETPPAAAPASAAMPEAKRVAVAPPTEVSANPENLLTLALSNGQSVTILLRPDVAPAHVDRIRTLVRSGFYNGLTFHRVVPGFMAQGGDPTGSGEGGSQLPDVPAEFNTLPHMRGTVAAARTSDPNTFNSQFYIMLAPRLTLDRKYTVFGRVISGMAAVDAIAPGEPPAEPTRIVRATLGEAAPSAG